MHHGPISRPYFGHLNPLVFLPARIDHDVLIGDHAFGRHKHHHNQKANFVFSGTWSSADSSLNVTGGNAKVRTAGFVGQNVKFDTTKTRVLVFDTNGDSDNTLADVKDGDTVLVQARLAKDGSATQPFKAKKLLDVTNLPSFGDGWDG